LSLSCTYSCARQRTRSARFGVCGVEVFSRQLSRQKLSHTLKIGKLSKFFVELCFETVQETGAQFVCTTN